MNNIDNVVNYYLLLINDRNDNHLVFYLNNLFRVSGGFNVFRGHEGS